MMSKFVFNTLLLAVSLLLSSCGTTQKTKPTKQAGNADVFASMSLNDIRNNIELLDTEVVDGDRIHDNHALLIDEFEARLTDIPTPMCARLLHPRTSLEVQNNDITLSYISTMSIKDAVDFYSKEMERLGWGNTCSIQGDEQFQLFEKPGRLCSVIIRAVSTKGRSPHTFTKIVIFLASDLHRA